MIEHDMCLLRIFLKQTIPARIITFYCSNVKKPAELFAYRINIQNKTHSSHKFEAKNSESLFNVVSCSVCVEIRHAVINPR